MINPIEFLETEERRAAVIHLTIPRARIGAVMGPAIVEVMQAVQAQGLAPAGPVFSHHHRISPGEFDFDVGVPVNADVTPVGRVMPGTLPAASIARTVYRGPYEGLGEAWEAFDRAIRAAGREPAAGIWECYLKGPESGSDPGEWQTELNHVVAPE